MQRIIRTVLLVVSIVGVVSTLITRFGPRVKEFAAATQAFWSNPKVVRAREKAWEQAHRAAQAEASGGRGRA